MAVVIGTVCIISYTLFGGFLAVSWTDLVQGLLMAAALVLVPVIALQSGSSDQSLMQSLGNHNKELLDPWTSSEGKDLTWIAILSLAAWGLGYFGQPHILARFAGIRSKDDVPTARRIAVTWSALSMAGAILVGLVGLIYMNTQGQSLGDGENHLHGTGECHVPSGGCRYSAGGHSRCHYEYCGFTTAGVVFRYG